MIILLYGEDVFRLNKKLKEIANEYKTKHTSGLNYICFDDEKIEFNSIKSSIESVSMFNEKKLIILKNILHKEKSDLFWDYAKSSKLKNNEDIITVVFNEGRMAVSKIKRLINMSEEFKNLKNYELTNWIKKEVAKQGKTITTGAINKIAGFFGGNLYQISNEINKLVSYKTSGLIEENDADLLIKGNFDNNIFKTLDAIAYQNRKLALRLLHEHLEQGENEFYLLTMFVYQMRNLIRIKSLMENGVNFQSLAKESGIHPYVVQKSCQFLRRFDAEQLKDIYRQLLSAEIKIKSGQMDGLTALDMLVMEI